MGRVRRVLAYVELERADPVRNTVNFVAAIGGGQPVNVYVDVNLQVGVDYKIFLISSNSWLEVSCTTASGYFRTAFSWYSGGSLVNGPYYQNSLPTGFYTLKITTNSGFCDVQVGNQAISGSLGGPISNGSFIGLGTGSPSVACSFRNFRVEYQSSIYGSGLYANCDTANNNQCCSSLQLTIPRNLNVSGTGCNCNLWTGTWELSPVTPTQATAFYANFNPYAGYNGNYTVNVFGAALYNTLNLSNRCAYMLTSGLPCSFTYLMACCGDLIGAGYPSIEFYFIVSPTCGACDGVVMPDRWQQRRKRLLRRGFFE